MMKTSLINEWPAGADQTSAVTSGRSVGTSETAAQNGGFAAYLQETTRDHKSLIKGRTSTQKDRSPKSASAGKKLHPKPAETGQTMLVATGVPVSLQTTERKSSGIALRSGLRTDTLAARAVLIQKASVTGESGSSVPSNAAQVVRNNGLLDAGKQSLGKSLLDEGNQVGHANVRNSERAVATSPTDSSVPARSSAGKLGGTVQATAYIAQTELKAGASQAIVATDVRVVPSELARSMVQKLDVSSTLDAPSASLRAQVATQRSGGRSVRLRSGRQLAENQAPRLLERATITLSDGALASKGSSARKESASGLGNRGGSSVNGDSQREQVASDIHAFQNAAGSKLIRRDKDLSGRSLVKATSAIDGTRRTRQSIDVGAISQPIVALTAGSNGSPAVNFHGVGLTDSVGSSIANAEANATWWLQGDGRQLLDLAIAKARVSGSGGVSSLELTLVPAHLGKLKLSVHADADGSLQVQFTTANEGAKALIERFLPELRSQLVQNGFPGVNVNVASDQGSGRQTWADRGGSAGNERVRTLSGVSSTPPEAAAAYAQAYKAEGFYAEA